MRTDTNPLTLPNAVRSITAAAFAACLALAVLACAGRAQAHEPEAEAASGATTAPNLIVQRQEADRLWVFAESPEKLGAGGEFHIYLDPETHPEAHASFAEFGLGAGGALPAHKHERTVEISYFLSGEGVVQVFDGDEMHEVPVHAGTVWYVPRGTWHGLRNTGDEPLKLVFAAIPNEETGLLSFFRRIGAKPGETPQPLPQEDFARIAAEHDLVLRPASVE